MNIDCIKMNKLYFFGVLLFIQFNFSQIFCLTCSKEKNLPKKLGEVASCAIGNFLITVGEGNPNTFIYNKVTKSWLVGAKRFDTGNHHGAVVHAGKCYILGGLSGGAGKVQVYDPVKNVWTQAPKIPIKTGSAAAQKIGSFIYYCGGIQGSKTINNCVRLNLNTNKWENVKPMPQGVNHAASCTDGVNLYVFGGRKGGNTVGKGYDYVQVYNPGTNTWTLKSVKLPEARGGMGNCVCASTKDAPGGACYIFGGETTQGNRPYLTPQKTYTRIDKFDLTTGTFSLAGEMPVGLHGIFPVFYDGKIHIAGGGDKVANSQSVNHLACA
eukprot:TRINITY_DN44170_c0_g3_i2.p1 TRINITY_DN44170_c0_g3~~TRINITY_DN44170_c0_g3_i2.p1  ORF type:complete len:335 (+),score=39.56 TRINITY_DN44170_c0_g3_i2:32-1006(+)